jgi:hypothetical protein
MLRILSAVADVIIVAADVLRDRRKAERSAASSMALTEHERRCVLRYRGRCVAEKLGVSR